jgi:hypothetical protein
MTSKRLSTSFRYNFLLDGRKQLLKHRQYVSPETIRYTDIDDIIANPEKTFINPSFNHASSIDMPYAYYHTD